MGVKLPKKLATMVLYLALESMYVNVRVFTVITPSLKTFTIDYCIEGLANGHNHSESSDCLSTVVICIIAY